MSIKSIVGNKDKKKNIKDLIYLKELKPEMTQCRIVQVDKKIKEKSK